MATKNLSVLASRATLLTTDRIAAWPTGDDVPQRATLEALVTFLAADRTIAQSAIPSALTGTTTETILATIPIAANAIGANGRVGLVFYFTYTNSANSKTIRVRYSGIGGTSIYQTALTTTANHKNNVDLMNRGSTNSQITNPVLTAGGWGGSTGTPVLTTVDTTAATSLVITGTLANAAETMTLEYWFADVFKKA